MLKEFLSAVSVEALIVAVPVFFAGILANHPGTIIVCAGVGLVLARLIPKMREQRQQKLGNFRPFVDNSVSIIGDNNTFAPKYNTNINLNAPPEFKFTRDPVSQKNSDGTFTVTYYGTLTAPASRLSLQAQGKGLLSFEVGQTGALSTPKQSVESTRGSGFIGESFYGTPGSYEIRVVTSVDEVPKIAKRVAS